MKSVAPALLLGLSLTAAANAQQADGYWEYDDWSAATTLIEGADSTRVRCVVMQEAMGEPTVRVEILADGPPPPERFPALAVVEIARVVDGTTLVRGETVGVVIGNVASSEHLIAGTPTGDGFQRIGTVIPGSETQPLLQAMAAGAEISIVSGGRTLVTHSLIGFSDAYAKAMDECGYPTTGVLD